jgi:hypothetical protein
MCLGICMLGNFMHQELKVVPFLVSSMKRPIYLPRSCDMMLFLELSADNLL